MPTIEEIVVLRELQDYDWARVKALRDCSVLLHKARGGFLWVEGFRICGSMG